MAEFIYTDASRRARRTATRSSSTTLRCRSTPARRSASWGPNGMGKSTLLKIMAGLEEVTNGEARLHARAIPWASCSRNRRLTRTRPFIENIVQMAFGDMLAKVDRFNAIGEEMADARRRLRRAHGRNGQAARPRSTPPTAWDLDSQLSQAMDALQCPDPDMPVNVLSGGERRRVALCRLLLEAPDLLLLDEPTNHLDAESVLWLEQFLRTLPRRGAGGHARPLLPRQRGRVDLRGGPRAASTPTRATTPPTWRPRPPAWPPRASSDAKLAKRLQKPSSNGCVRAPRRARPRARRASGALRADGGRGPRVARSSTSPTSRFPWARVWARRCIEAEHLHKAFGDRVLIDDLSFTLPRNGIVGVIGPNGVGKSTLFKMIMGTGTAHVAARSSIGETVKISYVDQNREGIDPNKTLWEVVSDGLDYMKVGDTEIPSRAYVASFGFKGSDQQKPAGVLSGGERNRLNLALTLKQGGNLLLLDEPTNDLDVETLSSLEEALLAFPGCAVVTSHDRMVPRPHCHAYPGVGRHRRESRTTGSGSRATSIATRRTASNAWAKRPPSRTASIASSPATKQLILKRRSYGRRFLTERRMLHVYNH